MSISLLVPRQKLAEAQQAGDVLAAHHILTEAYHTDVRPLLAKARDEMGVPVDPSKAYLSSGYEEKIAAERGTADTGGGYQS
jgi:L-rhamnose isomerase/sugar isomerase